MRFLLGLAAFAGSMSFAFAQQLESLSWFGPEKFGRQPNRGISISDEAASSDLSRVVAVTDATNLRDRASGLSEVYLLDGDAANLRFIAQGSSARISADGRYATFVSSVALVAGDVDTAFDDYLYDIDAETFERLPRPA